MNGKLTTNSGGIQEDKSLLGSYIDSSSAPTSVSSTDGFKCSFDHSSHGKRKHSDHGNDVKDISAVHVHPVNEILLWHNAIRKELRELGEEARRIQSSDDYSHLKAFNERFQFVAQVCVFHR